MAAPCETCFICSGCNRLPNCVDWGSNGLIAFGAENSLALYKFHNNNAAGAIRNLLKGHKGKVHCVKWLQQNLKPAKAEDGLEIISGAADNEIIIWRIQNGIHQAQSHLQGHNGVVTAVDGVYIPSVDGSFPERPHTLLASASVDSTVKIWQRNEGEEAFQLLQSISFGNGFALDVALAIFPVSHVPILAIGGDDTRVHLYVLQGTEFIEVQTLRGHEDWIRGLEFAVDDCGDLLLASCSQDCFIRLWRITRDKPEESSSIKLKGNIFTVSYKDIEAKYVVTLESLLAGHEQWIYGVHWQPPIYSDNGDKHQPMCLLSASMDKTMIIWQLDVETGVWVDKVRVGEVGGNTLGLYGCQFAPDGKTILAHGYQGAFHVWSSSREDESLWEPAVTVSGHFQSVEDIVWDPEGSFLVSVSKDQTTRLFAPWRRDNKQATWHELARPQVHGYDMQCLAMIGRFKYVSGADEKVLRAFEAPVNFLNNFQQITKEEINKETLKLAGQTIPEGASVPALGLSNKAIYQGESGVASSDREITHPSDQYSDIFFEPVTLLTPPTEEHLLQNTLWPETQKLYGHGFEIFAIASHPAGTLIASACKASKQEHANIMLWDTTTWRQVGELSAHSLTVTQLAFSHSGKFLLAVSRDRTWSLFEAVQKQEEKSHLYQKVACTDRKTGLHTRIIWSCSWAHNDQYFATSSRDKKVIIWGSHNDESQSSSCLGNYRAHSTPLDVGVSATAVDFAPVTCPVGSYVLAVGLESGNILLYKWTPDSSQEWIKGSQILLGHTMTVKRLRWRPVKKNQEKGVNTGTIELASCSTDCSLYIHGIQLDQV
ncbi:elongator complex protein 2-like [Apostichopus japonicus]|uniref:elongator complex protein 2-like n=1 Tax=Stichopus japonicus TaxID=307972 RepID=UPI003AB458C8